MQSNKIQGVKISGGYATAMIHHINDIPALLVEKFGKGETFELERFTQAKIKASAELELLSKTSIARIGEEHASIFLAQKMMLEDPTVSDLVIKKIKEEHLNASFAFKQTMSEMIDLFEISDNLYIKERILDLKDITKRMIEILSNEDSNNHLIERDVIIVTDDLTPSETMNLDTRYIKGIITKNGSKTSHMAILARHLGIPAVSGIDVTLLPENALIIIDGELGLIIVSPTENDIKKYEQKQKVLLDRQKIFNELVNLKGQTKDLHGVNIYANIGSDTDIDHAISHGAKGIGLLRTENQYMEAKAFPSEVDLTKFYQMTANAFRDSSVVVRTLDIGGDKNLSYLNIKPEQNPFLGNRAIRYSLSYPALFKSQLRAILLANQHKNLSIMFPMISTLDELLKAKEILLEAIHSLKEEFIEVNIPKVGMMVEVPSAAIGIEKFIPHLDFVSIGTNDLIQYMFAADRMNDKVSYLYQPYNPILLKTIKNIVDKAHQFGIIVSVCGEMAAQVKQALLLVGLGVDTLSMNANSIPEIKYMLSLAQFKDLKKVSNKALKLDTNSEVHDIMNEYIKKLE